MKILLLTDGITPFVTGGMQKHSFMLAKYLAKQGVQIELHHCVYEGDLPNDNNLFEPEESKNIKVFAHYFPKSIKFTGHYIYRSYLYSKILFKTVKKRLQEFDFVYAKGFTAWKLMQEKKKGVKCPPIGVKFHGYEMYQKAPSFQVKLEHNLFRPFVNWNTIHADKVFSYGGKITDIIKGLGVSQGRIIEVPSGVEEDFIRSIKEIKVNYSIRFCFIGRYERRKGIEELSAALKQLIQQKIEFEFHFIGPIPKEKQIEDERIVYHGLVKDIEKKKSIIDACDIMVVPSHSEGMPNVILEGMARGCGIIATEVGAVSTLVDSENGLIIEPSVESISRGLTLILESDKRTISDMRENSLKKIENFKWSSVSKKLIQILKNN